VDTQVNGSSTAQSASKPVERRHSSSMSYDAFLREYVATNRPVVVENAVQGWPALQRWTPDFFKTNFGSHRVDVSYEKQMTFADFIDGVLASTEESPGPYMFRFFIGPHLPALLRDVLPQNAYAFPRRLASPLMPKVWRRPDGYLKLLIGGVGGRFPVMHYDTENMHAAITEIYGDKAFVMYPPEDTQYLYPQAHLPNKTAIKDIDAVDLAQFPLFAKATRYETVLHPGDMVFVPSRWWHTARVLTVSVSVCQNMLDDSNWKGYVDEASTSRGGSKLKQLAKRIYLTGLGAALRALEALPRSPSTGHLAPRSSAEAQDPSGWPMDTWIVE
jgi:Cupin-like domain